MRQDRDPRLRQVQTVRHAGKQQDRPIIVAALERAAQYARHDGQVFRRIANDPLELKGVVVLGDEVLH